MAIERNPHLDGFAARTLELNGVSGIAEVRPCAAGDRKQQRTRLVIPAHHGADASLHRKPRGTDAVLDVESLTIDELTRTWPCVDFVKIDSEGSEPAIWLGMARTLSRNLAIAVVLEFKPATYWDAAAFRLPSASADSPCGASRRTAACDRSPTLTRSPRARAGIGCSFCGVT